MAVERWFVSKVDWWLAILIALAPFVSIAALISTLITGDGFPAALGGVLFLAALYGGLVLPLRYGFDGEHLVVRHGLVRQRIRLRDITEVRPTRSPRSSPALSLDRVAIQFGEGLFRSVMISPEPRAEFLAELATRAELRRDGDRLVR